MDYVDQMQKTGAFNTAPQPTPGNPRPFVPQQPQKGFSAEPSEASVKLAELQDALANLKNKFDRTISIYQNRVDALEREVSELKKQVAEMMEKFGKLKDKEVVEQSREKLFSHKDRPPLDKPIDRNNVAPSDVQIGNIFNMSGKKF
jgi:ribosomal protein L9